MLRLDSRHVCLVVVRGGVEGQRPGLGGPVGAVAVLIAATVTLIAVVIIIDIAVIAVLVVVLWAALLLAHGGQLCLLRVSSIHI